MAPFYWPVGCPDPKPQKSLHSLPNPDELLEAINEAADDTVTLANVQDMTSGTL